MSHTNVLLFDELFMRNWRTFRRVCVILHQKD